VLLSGKSLQPTPPVERASAKPPALEVAVAQTATDWEVAHQLLDQEHFLGAGREAGDRLCQFILEDGQIVAVLIWCAAAWHLKGRDETIGWNPVTRSHRLKLVVQLRRFLVLDKARRPNLASQSLGLALRSITAQWHQTHRYEPLLAESFSDPSQQTRNPPNHRRKRRRLPRRDQRQHLGPGQSLPNSSSGSPPFLDQTERGHGRLDNRKYRYAPISPVEAGLPYARSTFECQRTWVDLKDLEDPDLEVRNHTRNFLSSLNPGNDLGKLTRAAGVIRNH